MMQEAKPITHAQLVSDLKKSGQEIAVDLAAKTENKVVLLHEALRSISVSQTLDRAKKQAIYNKPQGIRAVGVNLTDNLNKLVIARLDAKQSDLLHMAIGILGEAGELLEAVTNHILDNTDLDIENVIEELGDLEFFMEGFRQNQNISRDETISQNISKLSVRYGSGSYSDAQAQNRADKTGD